MNDTTVIEDIGEKDPMDSFLDELSELAEEQKAMDRDAIKSNGDDDVAADVVTKSSAWVADPNTPESQSFEKSVDEMLLKLTPM